MADAVLYFMMRMDTTKTTIVSVNHYLELIGLRSTLVTLRIFLRLPSQIKHRTWYLFFTGYLSSQARTKHWSSGLTTLLNLAWSQVGLGVGLMILVIMLQRLSDFMLLIRSKLLVSLKSILLLYAWLARISDVFSNTLGMKTKKNNHNLWIRHSQRE